VPGPGTLAGVRVIELTSESDDRGSFTELFRSEWFPGLPPMVQSNVSRSRPGVLRGMHFHRRQADYWCVLEGRSLVALFDVRSGSPTERQVQTIDVDAAAGLTGVYVPPGIAHGFFARTDMTLHYLVDRAFDGTDEFGFSWRDPGLAVDWPSSSPILSDRDERAPALGEALADPPRWVDLPPAEA
jgi:dTDP-4-dehydrorhamnose 3,5-epimerase